MTTAPYELSQSYYRLPLPGGGELWPLQQEAVNTLAPLQRAAYYAEVGTGKTAMSTSHAIYQQLVGMADCHVITVPPILVTAWVAWLQKIPGARAVAYEGTPRQRKQIQLTALDEDGKVIPAHDFVVMSLPIFKQDFAHISEAVAELVVGLIVDEATAVKNSGTDNHRMVAQFAIGRPLILLTGTPLATPNDGFAYVKLLAPEIYRNKRVFDSVHVTKVDFFGNVQEWGNLEILQKNMQVNSIRLRKKDVLPDLPDPIYQPIPYKLDPEHYALYERIAEEQILELESGGKIDATSVSKLWNCLQQVILNWDYFSECPGNVSAGFELCDEIFEELGAGQDGGRKLLMFANYRMTARAVAQRYQRYNVQIVNGEVTGSARENSVQRFIHDPTCWGMSIQPRSGGFGVDGLQTVCSDVLFLECPTSAILFPQAVGRVDRAGQTESPLIRIAVAQNTLQQKLHRLLLNNDELTTFVQGGWKSLRESLYGG